MTERQRNGLRSIWDQSPSLSSSLVFSSDEEMSLVSLSPPTDSPLQHDMFHTLDEMSDKTEEHRKIKLGKANRTTASLTNLATPEVAEPSSKEENSDIEPEAEMKEVETILIPESSSTSLTPRTGLRTRTWSRSPSRSFVRNFP